MHIPQRVWQQLKKQLKRLAKRSLTQRKSVRSSGPVCKAPGFLHNCNNGIQPTDLMAEFNRGKQ